MWRALAKLPRSSAVTKRLLPAPPRQPMLPRASEAVRLILDKPPIWIVVSSEIERTYRRRAGKKEPWTLDWLRSRVQPEQVLYDIGANVGVFSLIGAIHRGARVFAVEPGFASFARLCENIRLNRCDQRIMPLPWMLAARRELRDFRYRSIEPGQSRHISPAVPAADENLDEYRQPMCALPLDELVTMFGLPAPHHIKLDVDGAEEDVLRGAAATLQSSSLLSVLVEADSRTGRHVEAMLVGAGLRLETRHVREDKPNAPWYGVFVRS